MLSLFVGHYIPQWSLKVLDDDILVKRFKGALIGNPYVRVGSLMAGALNAMWGFQMIPQPLWEEATRHSCDDMTTEFSDYSQTCTRTYYHFYQLLRRINPCNYIYIYIYISEICSNTRNVL